MQLQDSRERYGAVSRFFHWGMALAIAWQFTTVLTGEWLEDTTVGDFMGSTHKPVGFLILALALTRLVWALVQCRQRPPELNVFSRLGHMGLYALFLVVPTLALVRQYGSGRAFEPFGIPLFAGFDGGEIAWLVEPGNLLHGTLGWILLAAIVGHILMVVWHSRSARNEDVMPRMWR